MNVSKPVLSHDANGLTDLKREAVKDPTAALRPVAKQFESVFMQMMIKSMRSATEDGGLFSDEGGKMARDLFDNQMAVNLSEKGGIGIADALVKQLAPSAESQSLQLSLRADGNRTAERGSSTNQ